VDYKKVQKDATRNLNVAERLERLRVERQLTWSEVAARIGISVSMIHQVKRGDCNLGPKALFRLGSAEREAGLKLIDAPSAVASLFASEEKAISLPETPQTRAMSIDEKIAKWISHAQGLRERAEMLIGIAEEFEHLAAEAETLAKSTRNPTNK
jgi:transcriptional regulator with XRE-family HTH domain